jgi:hypothetical protein
MIMSEIKRKRLSIRERVGIALVICVIVAITTLSIGPINTATAASCTGKQTVYFMVYQWWPNPNTVSPAPNGCWPYGRIYQNRDAESGNFMIGHSSGTAIYPRLEGYGPLGIFDETNPAPPQTNSSETFQLDYFAGWVSYNIHTEFMARRSQGANSWCTNRGYTATCWRRNPGTGLTQVSRYAAELYSGTFAVDDYWNTWAAGGYGASPTNSYPALNIQPLIYNYLGNTTQLYNKVLSRCKANPTSTLYLYSGSTSSAIGESTSSNDVIAVNKALNACTTS